MGASWSDTTDQRTIEGEWELSLEKPAHPERAPVTLGGAPDGSPARLIREIPLNPGLYLLLGGIVVGLISGLQGAGSYSLFAVICGAASYIAVPAVQGMAIPEASPTLPIAASLGLTFAYNVTIGMPVYIAVVRLVTTHFPLG